MSEGMKVTRFGDLSGTVQNTTSVGGTTVIGTPSSGQVITSIGSNTANWQNNVSTITSNTSNTLLGPHVNFASGSNIIFSVASNTLTIHTLTSGIDHGALAGLADDDHSAYETVYGGGGSTVKTVAASGSSLTLNPADGNVFKVTLTTTCTISLTSPASGPACTIEIYWIQDSTGGRTVILPTSVVWTGGNAQILSTTANAVDRVVLETTDGGTVWYATPVGGGASDLDDLTDVVITNAQTGDILRRGTTTWEDYAGHYEPVTHNPGSGPEIVYSSDDIVMEWTI